MADRQSLHQSEPPSLADHSLLSRRAMLRRVALFAGGAVTTSLLAACGSSGGTAPTSTSGATTAATGGATTGGASPTVATVAKTPAGATTAAGSAASGQAKRGGTLHWYLPDDPPDLDPHQMTTSSLQWVLGMCYNGLLRYNVAPGNGPESEQAWTPVPDLATSYDNPDPLTYIFHLRQGVQFHDGTEMTAEDAAFSLNRIRTNSPEFQRAYAFAPVQSVEATDKYTVKVTMKTPYAPFINQLATSYSRIAPKHVIEKTGDMKQTIVGTGPFMLKSYQRNQGFTLVRNPNYFDSAVPLLDSIEIKEMPDNSTQLAAFNARQIDYYQPLSYAEAEAAKQANPNAIINEYSGVSIAGLGCNTTVKPLNDVRVRQALWYALDQDEIIKTVYGGHAQKSRAVSPSYAGWAVPPAQLPLSDAPNIPKAKQLLADAGYANGFDIKCKTVYRYTQKDATVAAQQFKKIGVNMQIIDIEYGAYLDARNKGDFEIIAFALGPFGDIEDFTTALYQTKASRNFGHWGNADLDALFLQGQQETDVTKRKAIYAQVQKTLAEQCWLLDTPRGTSFDAWHPYMKDIVSAQNPERGLVFWKTWLDK